MDGVGTSILGHQPKQYLANISIFTYLLVLMSVCSNDASTGTATEGVDAADRVPILHASSVHQQQQHMRSTIISYMGSLATEASSSDATDPANMTYEELQTLGETIGTVPVFLFSM